MYHKRAQEALFRYVTGEAWVCQMEESTSTPVLIKHASNTINKKSDQLY